MAESRQEGNISSRAASSTDATKSKRDPFSVELDRVRESMQKDKMLLKQPHNKEFTPYVYNPLRPFFETKSVERFHNSPRSPKHAYASRWTASTLVDPWQAYRMDATVLPEIERANSKGKPMPRQRKDDKKELRKEGSTRLPPWPVVDIRVEERRNEWSFTDVPHLRKMLADKYTLNAGGKMKKDYERTKQDFYRMELDKLDEVQGEKNRRNLRLAYHAYLKNTPGSRQALLDCLKNVQVKDKDKPKQTKAQESDDKTERAEEAPNEPEPEPAAAEENNQLESTE